MSYYVISVLHVMYCVITQCRESGIVCWDNALVGLEGEQTKVDGNGTSGGSCWYGLNRP